MPRILYVYAPAGPPLDYCFPKIAARGEVHTCIVSPPSDYNRAILQRHSASISDFTDLAPPEALQGVRKRAQALQPDAVFTFSEFLLKSVSELAAELGLRNVGPHIERGRNKLLMRQRWQEAGVPQPAFRAVPSAAKVARIAELRWPVLLKLAYGAGSIGQQIVRGMDEVEGAVARLLSATEAARRAGKHEFCEHSGFPLLIAEEVIESTTDSWYEDEGYGDYLSVEGLVRGGVYHPLAMTGRLRTIEPFTELGNLAPCVLPPDRKRQVVAQITRAVDALGFVDCATHTEIKLMANGQLAFLETAARMGGVAIAKQLDHVFGIDYVDLFLSVLLGSEVRIPAFEENPPRGAAASVAVIACDSRGKPWRSARAFESSAVDWAGLVGRQAEVHIELAQSIPMGSRVPPYDVAGGLLNYAGQAFLVSHSSATLKSAAYQLLDGLEQQLPLLG